jgi:hypothetical protein
VYTTCQTYPVHSYEFGTHRLFRARVTHMCCFVSLIPHACNPAGGMSVSRTGYFRSFLGRVTLRCGWYWHVTWYSRARAREWPGRGSVGVAACCLRSGPAARARRLFCNKIYNYNCKLTLSSGPESRSYGISINYRFNLSPMSTTYNRSHDR